jgi:hypothetical protein
MGASFGRAFVRRRVGRALRRGLEKTGVKAMLRLTGFFFAFLALCCGCATTVVRENPANAALAEALLSGMKGVRVQSVSGAWKDEAFAAECVLKGDGEKFTAVLLAPQMRLATLTIEKPHTIRWERVPQLPASLDPEHVMFDLALAGLSTETLAKALGNGYRVDETADGRRRTVFDIKRNGLQSVRQILPGGDVYFRNVQYGYEFTIKTMSHEN